VLRAIAVGMFIYITHPLMVRHGMLPDGYIAGILYALSVVGALSIVTKKG
jgi:hypothetical protein